MKQKHEYLETSLWYKEEITDPYQTIADFSPPPMWYLTKRLSKRQ
jgi:hypothetical protein